MDEKKTFSISVTGLLLVIAIIIIAIMAYFLYHINIEKQNAILENNHSNDQISSLENTVSSLQTKLDTISNTLNTDVSSEEKSTIITEKQSLDAAGYTITLYSNNEVKITPIIEDLQLFFGDSNMSAIEKSYSVTGFEGEIEKMYQGNNGTSVDPITFFIMKDGTVQYIFPLNQIIENNHIIPTSFTVDGKIDDLNNVVDLKSNSADVIIAVTKNGEEIKCWNEWMESME